MTAPVPRRPRGGSIRNWEVVTYALAELGGAARAVHLELIAVRAFTLAPGAFRWDLDDFADHIDKDKVRVSLTDARKPQQGELVRAVAPSRRGLSKSTDAWRLTPAGVAWLDAQSDRLSAALGVEKPRLKRGKADRLRKRVKASELYTEYATTARVTPSPYAFSDLVECSPDARTAVFRQRFDHLRGQVVLLRDADLLTFLDVCGRAHEDLLLDEGSQT